MSCKQLTKYTVDPVSGNITLSGGPDGTTTIVPTNATYDGANLTIWGGALEAPLVVPIDLSDLLREVATAAPITGDGTPGDPITIPPGTYLDQAAHDASLQPVYGNDDVTVLFHVHAA